MQAPAAAPRPSVPPCPSPPALPTLVSTTRRSFSVRSSSRVTSWHPPNRRNAAILEIPAPFRPLAHPLLHPLRSPHGTRVRRHNTAVRLCSPGHIGTRGVIDPRICTRASSTLGINEKSTRSIDAADNAAHHRSAHPPPAPRSSATQDLPICSPARSSPCTPVRYP
ncbi:hypothetical protein K505DRAFT_342323 [Melanomma pulvis-pyrius CBS 109.77]|uniref:Uncharacterized protein n=1 Tax=Melanomma pulvis-pyrius CBS 109.77 TaxID=1314802 RepID=A0A6A6WVK6_9PLEO|nr:hypothetical protein K505DRAFT_342323 [Melanomma pulvis-pyrius CBS 109.77]